MVIMIQSIVLIRNRGEFVAPPVFPSADPEGGGLGGGSGELGGGDGRGRVAATAEWNMYLLSAPLSSSLQQRGKQQRSSPSIRASSGSPQVSVTGATAAGGAGDGAAAAAAAAASPALASPAVASPPFIESPVAATPPSIAFPTVAAPTFIESHAIASPLIATPALTTYADSTGPTVAAAAAAAAVGGSSSSSGVKEGGVLSAAGRAADGAAGDPFSISPFNTSTRQQQHTLTDALAVRAVGGAPGGASALEQRLRGALRAGPQLQQQQTNQLRSNQPSVNPSVNLNVNQPGVPHLRAIQPKQNHQPRVIQPRVIQPRVMEQQQQQRVEAVPRAVSEFGDTESVRDMASGRVSDEGLQQGLLQLAEAVATGDQPRMVSLTRRLRPLSSPYGTPMQRVSHYLLTALAKRAAGALGTDYIAYLSRAPEEEALILAFAAHCPTLQFCYSALACAMLVRRTERWDAAEDETNITHIVDFAIGAMQTPSHTLPGSPPFHKPLFLPCCRTRQRISQTPTSLASLTSLAVIVDFAVWASTRQRMSPNTHIVDFTRQDESNIHIVDFAMWAGQWPIVIRQLAAAARKRMAAAAVTINSHNSSSSSGSSSSSVGICDSTAATTSHASKSPSASHPSPSQPTSAHHSPSPSSSPSPTPLQGPCTSAPSPIPPCFLRIRFTAVDPPFGHPYGTGPKLPAAFLQAELARAAQECGVSLSFSRVEAAPETLRAAAIGVERGECVLVNVAGRLACVADSTVLRHSPKDTAIKLDPKVVSLVEWDSNQQQPFFLHRFKDALLFFHNIFASHDALASRFSFGRRGFEEFVLAREMVNLVACEGMQRLVRAERLDQMHTRMGRLGVAARPYSKRSMWGLRELIAPYPKGFAVERHPQGGVRLLWNGQSILGASAWTPGGGDGRK
ncbi:unnamed protein product [Closterium sp. NIES-64]|nr:unnamed protein product [Closterium sp. NIES-64]